jgi:hypothetical protein
VYWGFRMRLLVKAHPAAQAFRLGSGGPRPSFALRPLMPNLAASLAPLAFGATETAAAAWHVSDEMDDRLNPWDACHALMSQGLGMGTADAVSFAEPDLEQNWLAPTGAAAATQGFAAAGDRSADCTMANPQSADYPRGPHDGWFADTDFSGLAAAREAIAGAPRIRLAHLDTGYDPDHRTTPRRLLGPLSLNFADTLPDGRPNPGAIDRRTAAVNPMFGHGAATLALLAGEAYGGARGFEVLPLRVANWVVLFRNSAISAALDHVLGLAQDPATRCDVLSMSMGGLASAAWADAVNALYDAGVVLVTAAGNNFGNMPIRSVVYPARFNRVLAACGVMANGQPYADLPLNRMAGCYGPMTKMRTALSAWTPNLPWARFGCRDRVDQDGGGTSSATPQIAAAAALWLHHHRAALANHRGWQRVEAVRQALFAAAGGIGRSPDLRLGRGLLRARAALDIPPAAVASLVREEEDRASFAPLQLLSGIGLAASPQQRMLELEALQISQSLPAAAEALLAFEAAAEAGQPDPANTRRLLQAVMDAPRCSRPLRRYIRQSLGAGRTSLPSAGLPSAGLPPPGALVPAKPAGPASEVVSSGFAPPVPEPGSRRLRVFAFDPGFAARLATRHIATTTIAVEWEADLQPGPVGDYLEVVDIDPASDRAYAPVDLNHPALLAQDGLPPSEGSPQFHQQMAYAVAMRTIDHFARALGRSPFWASRIVRVTDGKAKIRRQQRFVRRLRIYPHALREANAYYSPDRKALLFGYFRAAAPGSSEVLPGGMIFTCLSHDIVAHETTHALLDGLHPYWRDWTNPDVPAFHEAFADLVALFQHFTMPDALLAAIQGTRGNALQLGRALGRLAQQFGQAVGGHGALRAALDRTPQVTDYDPAKPPHALGEVLVAAVFDAWRAVYADRTADLVRLATNGTGVLPPGAIPHDLARRLAEEAAKLAEHFLDICIRALDYCPPVDPTFGEYLRAMITADKDLVREDPRGYRVALVEGFRARGILPADVLTWSPDAMEWEQPPVGIDLSSIDTALDAMTATWQLNGDRLKAWRASRRDARALHARLVDDMKGRDSPDALARKRALRAALGLLDPGASCNAEGELGTAGPIEVHSVRPLRRVGPDGQVLAAVVVDLTQRWKPAGSAEAVRGGCTLIWDRSSRRLRYVIYKRVGHGRRTAQQLGHRAALAAGETAMANYFGAGRDRREPFALLHGEH